MPDIGYMTELIAGIYDAATQPELWPATLMRPGSQSRPRV